jgi:hypothetical protein
VRVLIRGAKRDTYAVSSVKHILIITLYTQQCEQQKKGRLHCQQQGHINIPVLDVTQEEEEKEKLSGRAASRSTSAQVDTIVRRKRACYSCDDCKRKKSKCHNSHRVISNQEGN